MPIKFDLSDPETKATVTNWTPDTEYTIVTGEDPTNGIVETIDEKEGEQAGAPEAGAAPGPAAVKAAMGGMAGG